MSVRVVDLSAAFKAAIYAHLAGNLEDAASFYEEKVAEAISIQGPPRSTPGNPPHMDTRFLHDESLDHEVDAGNLIATIGSTASYAATLEISMDRPIFIPPLITNADEIARRICKP